MADSRPQAKLTAFGRVNPKIIVIGGAEPYLWVGDDKDCYGHVAVTDLPERFLEAVERFRNTEGGAE